MAEQVVPPTPPARNSTRRRVLSGLLALGAIVLILGVAQILADQVIPDVPGVVLTDLRSIEDLRTRFRQDQGSPRLILLLSPT